ncbi:MAG: glutathione S-transferase family protein [Myxococcales bacterium]|nr:glutathione S-transferase family protein [Myxococcales bacterium]
MKLYDCLIAPNPRRVRIFLDEKGIEIEKQEINILIGENLKPDFLAVNTRGIVPVLELDDGTRIDEAAAIWRYFEETQPDPPLMGRNAREKAIVDSWERRADQDGMLSARDFIRNQVPVFVGRGHPGRSIDSQIPDLVERGKNGMRAFHDLLEGQLETSEFVACDHFTVADITALCAVDLGVLGEFPGLDGYPAIRRWHTAVSARPSVEDWVTNIQTALAALAG